MNLSIHDRLKLLETLPRQGSYLTLVTVQDITEKVKLTKEERKAINLREAKDKPGVVMWDETASSTVDIEFDEAESSVVREAMEKLSTSGKLSIDHMSLYRLFVLGGAKAA